MKDLLRCFLLLFIFGESIFGQQQYVLNTGFEDLELKKFSGTMNSANPQIFSTTDTSLLWNLSTKDHIRVYSAHITGNSFYSLDSKANSGRSYALISTINISEDGVESFSGVGLLLREPLKSGKSYDISINVKLFS